MTSSSLVSKCTTMVVVLCLLNCASGHSVFKLLNYRPSLTTYGELHNDECKIKEETQALCQRCAKVTKSEIVYPMCCSNTEDARTWCDKYINFGI